MLMLAKKGQATRASDTWTVSVLMHGGVLVLCDSVSECCMVICEAALEIEVMMARVVSTGHVEALN